MVVKGRTAIAQRSLKSSSRYLLDLTVEEMTVTNVVDGRPI